jgi:hypothetical protein
VGVVVSILALLGAVPAVLAAAGVKNRWALAVAAGLAALVAGVLVVWQERYKKIAGRRDDQAFAVEDGCLVLPGGQLPAVRDVTSPLLLGVHKAQPVTASSAGGGSGRVVDGQVPVYVPRDVDAELSRAVLEASVRVLGPEHPGTLTSRSILATVLRDLGQLAEAEAESRAALEASVRVRGPEHPGTLAIRRNLILVLRDLGKKMP